MLIPYISIYFVLVELLEHATNINSINSAYVIRWAIIAVAGMGIDFVFMYVGGMCSHIAAFRILYGTRVKLSDHISNLPLGFFNKNAVGKIKKIVELDIERIELFIAHQLPDLVNAVVMVIAVVVMMFFLNPWLALACIIPMILGFAGQYSMMAGKKAQEGMKQYLDALEDINSSSIQYIRVCHPSKSSDKPSILSGNSIGT